MKRDELAPLLQKEYAEGRSCGVEKAQDPDLENIWFVVPPAPERTTPKGMPAQAIRRAIQVLEQLPRSDQADDLDRLISYLFVRREAVQSSRMEGTWSTIDHVLTPAELYDRGEGKSERGSVLGYAHALEAEFQSAFQNGTSIFSRDLICKLHREVVKYDPTFRGRPGQIRQSVVFIGGLSRKENSIYNPAPPRQVERCLEEDLAWLRDREIVEMGDAGMGMPLPVRMAIGHAHFEAVHPFSDGNGRVGRMLMTLQMAAHGVLPLYLSGFIEAEKDSYARVLEESQKKLNHGPIVEFICEAVVSSNAEAKETQAALRRLPEQWAERAKFRKESAAQRLLKEFISNPILTVKQVESLLSVTTPAANNAMVQLERAQVIRERTGDSRYRLFAAEEVIELLSRKFSESPSVALSRAKELLEGGAR